MLKNLDLSKKMPKKEAKEQMDLLTLRLGKLQQQVRSLNIPVLVAIEGWEAAGKGTQMNLLLQALDPRGYRVHMAEARDGDEKLKPYWWRFWTKTPAKGTFAFFDRCWTLEAHNLRYQKGFRPLEYEHACAEVNAFERQLSDDGTVILKFFLHISKKEQGKRFLVLEANENTAWKIKKADWHLHDDYDRIFETFQSVIESTDSEFARWYLIEAEDERFAQVKIFTLLCEAIEKQIEKRSLVCVVDTQKALTEQIEKSREAMIPSVDYKSSILGAVDLSRHLDKKEYEKDLHKGQSKIRDMEYLMYKKRVPLLVLYEGWDAAGKGGNIKRLTAEMDPRGYDVVPIAAPSSLERAHHYLWRFWNVLPKAGHVAILDRTWYGRVLVERVEEFCTEEEWKRAYREINEMEAQLVDAGMGLVKFWLHIDKEEQLKRFEERQSLEWKNWKITEEDWRNREKWDRYYEAVDEMLFRTGTTNAPWTVIEGNDKYYARMKAIKTVVETMEKRLKEDDT